MSGNAPKSFPCRYCRAENFVESSRCWLCDAGDWNPAAYGPLQPKSRNMGATAARREVGFDSGAMLAVLLLTTGLVVVGLAQRHVGLALVVGTIWWLTLGVMILRRRGLQQADVLTSIIAAVALAAGLFVVLVVAAVVLLFMACFTNGPLNFH